jgi:hypothetical protein
MDRFLLIPKNQPGSVPLLGTSGCTSPPPPHCRCPSGAGLPWATSWTSARATRTRCRSPWLLRTQSLSLWGVNVVAPTGWSPCIGARCHSGVFLKVAATGDDAVRTCSCRLPKQTTVSAPSVTNLVGGMVSRIPNSGIGMCACTGDAQAKALRRRRPWALHPS